MSSKFKNTIHLISIESWIYVVLGIIGVFSLSGLWDDAFPSASLDLGLKRAKVIEIAKEIGLEAGLKKVKKTTIYFNSDREARTFLQYELGNQKAKKLMKADVPVWSWKVWLYENDNDEPMKVFLGTAGQFHSLEWKPEKKRQGKVLGHLEAKKKVESYVLKRMKIDLTKWSLIQDRDSGKSQESEHTYTWQDNSRDYGGGKLRLAATVKGSTFKKIEQKLHIPDSFTNKYKKLRGENRALSDISVMFTLLFAFLIPFVFLWYAVKHQIRSKLAIGFAWFAGLVSFLTSMNNMSAVLLGCKGWDLTSFIEREVLVAIPSALLAAIGFAIFFSTIEVMYRKNFPNHVAIENILNGKAFRSKQLLNSIVVGIGCTLMWIVYVVAFYSFGKSFGLWAPLQLFEASTLSNACPAWDSMYIGIKASTIEEMGFRVFILILLTKATRSFWIANFLQAAIWAFGHCNYMVEPPYARGLELVSFGMLLGYLINRFGIVAVLIPHYTYDTFLGCVPLFFSSSITTNLTAWISIVPSFILLLIVFYSIYKKGVVNPESISNSSILTPTEESAEVTTDVKLPEYKPLTEKTIVLSTIAMFIVCLFFFIPVRSIGDLPKFSISRASAIRIAKDYFKRNGIDTKNMLVVAWVSSEHHRNSLQYVYDKRGFDKVKELALHIEPRYLYNIKFVNPSQSDFYELTLSPQGIPVSPYIHLGEKTEGAKLNKDEASKLVETFYSKSVGTKYKEMNLNDVGKIELANRIDYDFAVEVPEMKVAEAPFRLTISSVGNQVSHFSKGWKVPSDWIKDHEQTKEQKQGMGIVKTLLVAGLLVSICYWYLKNYARGDFNWRVVAPITLVLTTFYGLSSLNKSLVLSLKEYMPSESLNTYYVSYFVGSVMSICAFATMTALLILMLVSVKREYFAFSSKDSLKELLKSTFHSKRMWTDGIFVGLLTALVCGVFTHLGTVVLSHHSTTLQLNSNNSYTCLNVFSPFALILLPAIIYGGLAAMAAVLLEQWLSDSEYKGATAYTFILLAAFYFNTDAFSAKDLVLESTICFLPLMAAYVILDYIGRINWVSVFFFVYFSFLGHSLFNLYKSLAEICFLDGLLVLMMFAIPVVALIGLQSKAIINYTISGLKK